MEEGTAQPSPPLPKLLADANSFSPTGVEFAAELYDFLVQDVKRDFPNVQNYVKVTLVEGTHASHLRCINVLTTIAANSLLTSFDTNLGGYALKVLRKHKVEVLTGVSVKEIEKGCLTLSTGKKIDFGLCVWSTGIGNLIPAHSKQQP